jgi:aldehyde dehydrogenase family 7 protein A1
MESTSEELTFDNYPFLKDLGLQKDNLGCYNGKEWCGSGKYLYSVNPATGKNIARVKLANEDEYEQCIKNMEAIKEKWYEFPMPKRGIIVQELGDQFRKHKASLGKLVSLEMGKILLEGEGEIQEIIDICDYAVGLSRTLAGKVIPSERENHVILENWNPLGLIGVITAFNFPAAVIGWNTAISMVCGDLTIWKGATSTSLVSLAVTRIFAEVLEKWGFQGVFTMVAGPGSTVGEKLINDERLKLISFTGSTSVGKRISTVVHSRFGRTILELGGNNALVVMDDADMNMALPAAVFAGVGTCGQRCTSLRRLILHEKIYDDFVEKLCKAYATIKVGDPFDSNTLCGPLHSKPQIKEFLEGLEEIKKQGGKVLFGGKVYDSFTSEESDLKGGNYVTPTIVEIDWKAEIVKTELFVPILYVLKCTSFDEAVKINNSVPQGLSSGMFSKSVQNCFKWTGPNGSDCGIVNVNVGTSGAEIGGAFGGEKETGGGRESGGEAWRQYMRQTTCTVNYGNTIRLAQGVKFPHF